MCQMKFTLYLVCALLLTGTLNAGTLSEEVTLDEFMYIVGLFDVHNENGTCDPLDEGTIETMTAVRWYIEHTRDILPFNLGYKEYWRCNATFDDIEHLADQVKSDRNVIGFISSLKNRWTVPLSDWQYMYLRIAISSTSDKFLDRAKYPYFYRVVPSESKQMKTMVLLTETLGWKHIAVIFEGVWYGNYWNNAHEFRNALPESIECELESLEFYKTVRSVWENCYNIFSRFLSSTHPPEALIFFGRKNVANIMFRVLEDDDFKSLNIKAFILSSTVGLDGDVFRSTKNSQSDKSLIVSPPYREITSFTDYWTSLFTDMTRFKPAMKSFPLMKNVFEQNSHESCDPSIRDCDPFTPSYASQYFRFQPLFVQYGIVAAHIMVKILKVASERICSDNEYCAITNKLKRLIQREMKNLTVDFAKDFSFPVPPLSSLGFWLKYNNTQEPVASSDDDMYHVYFFSRNAVIDANELSRIQVGSLSYSEELFLNTTILKAHGFKMYSSIESDDSNSTLPVVLGTILGLLVIGICALAVYLYRRKRRTVNEETYMYITPTAETMYITPVADAIPSEEVCSSDRISILPGGSRNAEMFTTDHYDNLEDLDNIQNVNRDEHCNEVPILSVEQARQRGQQMQLRNPSKSTTDVSTNIEFRRLHDSL